MIGLAAAGACTAEPPSGAHPDWLRGCAVDGVDTPALCGTYEVWENRESREGRRIGINVVVLPALGAGRAPDPLFFFRGGPGAGATGAVRRVSQLLRDVHRHRDLVFVDVRGTGESNPLRCRDRPDDAPLQDHFREFLPDDYVRDCLARQKADVAWYTTPIAIDDVEEVRLALGYGPINLYGTSGGTRQQQLYLRRHPAAVRSAIMQGVAPLDAEMPLPFRRALEAGARAVIEDRAADPACSAAYPDLAADWERSKRRFDDAVVTAEVEHPQTGQRGRVEIDRGVYADGVRHILYSVANARRLPGMIHLAGQGDFDAFAQRELQQNIGFDRIIAMGALMSATCAEDLEFITEEDIVSATEGTFLGDYRVRRQLAACAIWGGGHGVDDDHQQLVESDVPVLLISGAVDTATPPDGAERVAEQLTNGRHVIFPNQSHNLANPDCAARLMADFIEAGHAKELDVSCVAETRRPPFDISLGRKDDSR